MSLESPDNEKNFPEEDGERGGVGRKRDSSRKRDGKKDKKEKGYTMFEEEDSEEEIILPEDVKSPTKVKKSKPGFKFPVKKDIFPRMKEKQEEKREKDQKEKEKKKEEKEGKKVKVKDKEKKKSKHGRMDLKPAPPPTSACENPIFGIPLAMAVDRNKSHDGIKLPAIVRECIDYVEECGLTCEGIYRISGVKSKVQTLKESYNKGVPVDLLEHEPNVVASLLKQFLRELPQPVLTTALMPKFEEASTIKNEKKKVEMFIRLIEDLPTCNRLLLSWMIVHMTHIIELQKENKMSLQNVSIVLSPTMQISHRVLNVLFTHAHHIFKDTYLKKYVPPLKPATSRWSLELPDNTGALEEELAKQESLLNQLHARLNAGRADPQTEEQLWEVQRVVTQLKRKIKFAKKAQGTAERRRKDLEVKRSSQLSDTEELHLELRQAPAPPPPSSTPNPTTTAAAPTTTTVTTTAAVVETHAKEPEEKKEGGSKEPAPKAEEKKAEKEAEVQHEEKEATQEEKVEPSSATDKASKKDGKDEARKSQEVKTTVGPPGAKAKRKSQELKEKVKPLEAKEKRKSQELQEQVKPQETQEKRKSQEPKEKRKSQELQEQVKPQETQEKRKSQEPKEKRKSQEVAAAESEAQDTPVPPPAHAEPPADQTKEPDETQPTVDRAKAAKELAADKHVAEVKEGRATESQATQSATGEPLEEAAEVRKEEQEGSADGQGEGEEKDTGAAVTLKDSLKGAGEVLVQKTLPQVKEPVAEAVVKSVPAVVEEKETKPRGPVQVHPHLYLSLEPLQPIKAQPLKPRRERPEKSEEWHRRSAKLRELEEELLGGGGSSQTAGSEPENVGGDVEKTEDGEEEDYEYDLADEEELQRLVEEEFSLRLEEEELLAIGDELRKKMETEESEIERLQQEIQELQYLRHDSDLEDMSSNSDSSYESEDEDDMNEMLSTLIQENLQLERENAEMCQKIHEERMICLSVKLQIRLLQQKQLESSQSSLLGDL